jgi:hypothetical protein
MILLLRSGASADRRKWFAYFQMAALCRDAATPNDAQLLDRPRQGADDEAASGFPERFAFRQVQTSRRRLAMTRQAWAKYQCQSRRADFQGDMDDAPAPLFTLKSDEGRWVMTDLRILNFLYLLPHFRQSRQGQR